MHKRGVEITVGLFILFGLFSLIVLALKVSGLSDVYTGHEGFIVTADFEKIGGLKPRSRVVIGGVQVGRVVSIRLNQEVFEDEEGTVNVLFTPRVTLALKESVRSLPSNSRAQIMTAGLLGDNYIEIEPGFAEGENDYLHKVGHIDKEFTNSPISLENIIEQFVSQEASGLE